MKRTTISMVFGCLVSDAGMDEAARFGAVCIQPDSVRQSELPYAIFRVDQLGDEQDAICLE